MSIDFTTPVDHRTPLHDHLCRCRVCKPSLVGKRGRVARIVAMAIVIDAAVAVIAAIWFSLASPAGDKNAPPAASVTVSAPREHGEPQRVVETGAERNL